LGFIFDRLNRKRWGKGAFFNSHNLYIELYMDGTIEKFSTDQYYMAKLARDEKENSDMFPP